MRRVSLQERIIELPLYLHYVADAVDTYNYALRSVPADHQPVFTTTSLRLNRRIRAALRRLEPREYRVTPTSMWPTAFEAMGAFPALQALATGERGRPVRQGRIGSPEDARERTEEGKNICCEKRRRTPVTTLVGAGLAPLDGVASQWLGANTAGFVCCLGCCRRGLARTRAAGRRLTIGKPLVWERGSAAKRACVDWALGSGNTC
jgi:hypothetical protein